MTYHGDADDLDRYLSEFDGCLDEMNVSPEIRVDLVDRVRILMAPSKMWPSSSVNVPPGGSAAIATEVMATITSVKPAITRVLLTAPPNRYGVEIPGSATQFGVVQRAALIRCKGAEAQVVYTSSEIPIMALLPPGGGPAASLWVNLFRSRPNSCTAD